MADRLGELLGSMLGGASPRRKPQRFPHKARLDADEKAIANAHGFEVWRDVKPSRGCCPCGYNVYRAGTHPGKPISLDQDGWPLGVHRSEVQGLLQDLARATS
jgi:hypothetical protein